MTRTTRIRIDYRALQPATGGFGMYQAGAEIFSTPAFDAGWDEYFGSEDEARYWLGAEGEMEPDPEPERYMGRTYDESGGAFWRGIGQLDGPPTLVYFTPVRWDAIKGRAVRA